MTSKQKQQEAMEIAKTIQKQILANVGQSVVWSWGADAWSVAILKHNGMDCSTLTFKVRGFLHKGRVRIIYLPVPDTYTVQLLKGMQPQQTETIITELTEVYCDEIGTVIDELVETKNDKSEEYKNKVQEFLKNTKL